MSKTLLRLENISFRYRDHLPYIFENVSLAVNEGEFLGIIGPNGGGKSTMLKIMALELKPELGRVVCDATQVYLPQTTHSNPLLPVNIDDFLNWGAPSSLSKNQRSEKKSRLLELMNLQDHQHKDLRILSGGQRQKTLIAQCLMRSPQLLLLDEPGQGLDKKSHDDVMKFLKTLSSELKICIIVIEHNLPKILEISDKVLCLGQGVHWHQAEDIDLKAIEHIYQHTLGLHGGHR